MYQDQLSHYRYDAVIVGARCAGAATALLLARRGAKVLMVDWASPGTHTISTHALMRGGVMQLSRWGVLPRLLASGTPPIRQTTFHYDADAICLPIKASHGVPALYAPRRNVLDGTLVSAARDAGVVVRYGIAFRDVVTDSKGRVSGAVLSDRARKQFQVSADLVIGADGRRSTVARRVNAKTEQLAQNCTASVIGYLRGLPDTGTHWHFGHRMGSGIIPTNNGTHCVFATMPQQRFMTEGRNARSATELGRLVAEVNPDCGAQIKHAELDGRMTGFIGQKGFFRRSWGRGWALVGDAGYFKDPLTAHGITDALRDAEILADAVAVGTTQALAKYQHQRDSLSADLFRISDAIAALDWNKSSIQSLHLQLNAAMKHEQDWMQEHFSQTGIAA